MQSGHLARRRRSRQEHAEILQKNMKPNDHLQPKLRPACLPPPPPLHSGTVPVLGQCHLCLLIQVVFPVILSFRCEHLQLFTVKCPLCSPSLPVCFQHYPYVLYILYSFTVPPHSAEGRSLAGLLGRSLLAVRKLTLIGLVAIRSREPVPPRHLPRRASLNENEAYSTAA